MGIGVRLYDFLRIVSLSDAICIYVYCDICRPQSAVSHVGRQFAYVGFCAVLPPDGYCPFALFVYGRLRSGFLIRRPAPATPSTRHRNTARLTLL